MPGRGSAGPTAPGIAPTKTGRRTARHIRAARLSRPRQISIRSSRRSGSITGIESIAVTPEPVWSEALGFTRGDHPRADSGLPGRPAYRHRGGGCAGRLAGRRHRRRLDRRYRGAGRGCRRHRPRPAAERRQGLRTTCRFSTRAEAGGGCGRDPRRRRPARPGRDPALPRGLRGGHPRSSSSAGATSARCPRSGGCRTRSAAGSFPRQSAVTWRTTSPATVSSGVG